MPNNEKVLFSTWVIDESVTTPLYKQLAVYIKSKIDSNDINIGYIFPTFRKMEDAFNVSRFTLSSCFDMLAAEGYVVQNKSRRFVVQVKATTQNNVDWQHFMKRANHNVNKALSLRNSEIIATEAPEIELHFVDCDEFGTKDIYTKAIKDAAEQVSLSINWHVLSIPELLEELSLFLQKREIYAQPSQILVTQNEHASLYLMSTALLGPSSTLITTKPNRFAQITALETVKTQTLFLKVDDDGIIIDDLYTKVKNAYNPILYIEPNYAYPSGFAMDLERQREIVDLCARMGVPIIEADIQRDCSLNYRPPMKSFDQTGNIIYQSNLGTMFSYNSSMGFITGSEYIINHLSGIYSFVGPQCTSIVQRLYLQLLKNGIYENLIESIKPALHKRLLDTDKLLKHYLSPYATWRTPDGGIFLVIKFNPHINFSRMNMIISKCNWEYYYENKNLLQIAVTSCSFDELEKFIAHIANECKMQLKK